MNDPSGAVLNHLAESEDGHEVVVVPLGGGEIKDANADVVDECCARQGSPPVGRLAKSLLSQ